MDSAYAQVLRGWAAVTQALHTMPPTVQDEIIRSLQENLLTIKVQLIHERKKDAPSNRNARSTNG
jgi:hypothetical protein